MDYKIKTALILPFKGEWTVGNGGRSPEKNSHYSEDGSTASNQIFAYDFSRGHKNDGANLSDYEAFDAEIIAPANGIVTEVVYDRPDLPIGRKDTVRASGNKILIDHENGEFSLIAHFKQNSIIVNIGERVNQGQLLGLCGNSGNTTEPHIHYHLQSGRDSNIAAGLPAQFKRINVNGSVKENYEPEYPQMISNYSEAG